MQEPFRNLFPTKKGPCNKNLTQYRKVFTQYTVQFSWYHIFKSVAFYILALSVCNGQLFSLIKVCYNSLINFKLSIKIHVTVSTSLESVAFLYTITLKSVCPFERPQLCYHYLISRIIEHNFRSKTFLYIIMYMYMKILIQLSNVIVVILRIKIYHK